MFKRIGITSVPDTLDSAWTWEEFAQVATKLRANLSATTFPFAYAWTRAGAYRWLSWLYQSGGSLLTPQLDKAAVPSAEATKALDFTKSFFANRSVPASNTIKGSRYSDEFFVAKTVPMAFVGDFLVPTLADPKTGYKGDWGVTYMPRDKGAASDLGGNAGVAHEGLEERRPRRRVPQVRRVSEDMMKYFCEKPVELPTLKASRAGREARVRAGPTGGSLGPAGVDGHRQIVKECDGRRPSPPSTRCCRTSSRPPS